MGSVQDEDDVEGYHIKEEGELGFIDYRSVPPYNLDKEGPIVISVPCPLVEGKPRSILVGQTTSEAITITNPTSEPFDLWKVDIYASNPKGSFTVSLMEPPSATSDEEYIRGFLESFSLEERVLQPGQTVTVWLSCKPKEIGLHITAVHIDVDYKVIERLVFLSAEDNISSTSNKPSCRDRKKEIIRDVSDTYVAASRPRGKNHRGYGAKLKNSHISKNIKELLENKKIPNEVAYGLSTNNYCSFFSSLLNMEGKKIEDTMRGYDMEGVAFGMKDLFLTLKVPGLAERRLTLVKGDYIYAQNNEYTKATYQGYIYRVEEEVVNLKFDQDFHTWYQPGNRYNVQFTYNCVNMRMQYQAIDKARDLEIDILFPSETTRKRVIRPAHLAPVSSMLNEEQKRSVQMILGCRGGAPYVIYGPPGTGKTVTIIEAILQIYLNKQRQDKILICAPSDSAADHVLEKLLSQLEGNQQDHNDILRLNTTSPHSEDTGLYFPGFSWVGQDRTFTCPPRKLLLHYRIIISTYMSVCLLYKGGIKPGHFSHIFLDEAGQASEPETMVPLSHLSIRGTVIVLAGDPMQLGPVVHSKDAGHLGLGISYLERLLEYEPYRSGNESYVMKLVRNYRCPPQILRLPSQLFYNNELIAMKDGSTDSQMDWLGLVPNREFPILFIGIQGYEETEGNNPSWFNRLEVNKVVEIVTKLTENKHISQEDIGVITPYRQQVLKLRETLESMDNYSTKIGSVEQFQGQERPVIIISNVRSTVKHNDFDKTHCLGFLSNKKRFNVAITRAMSLLIVIGNPHVIGKDPCWNQLLRHCVHNGSYEGLPYTDFQT